MTVEFKRKLYKRGSSFETTIPMPLLFALDKSKKHDIIFQLDPEANKWYIKFKEVSKENIMDKLIEAEKEAKKYIK